MVVLYFNTAMVAGSVHQEIEKLDEDFAKKLLGLQDAGAFRNRSSWGMPAGWFIYMENPQQNLGWLLYLVGGLEHEFSDFPYIGNNDLNWLSYFSKGLKPQPVI